MHSLESIEASIPEQCRPCERLSACMVRLTARVNEMQDWGIGRAAPALSLPVSAEDVQQPKIAVTYQVNPYESVLAVVSENEIERRIAQGYLRDTEWYIQENMLSPAAEEVTALQEGCPGTEDCQLGRTR
jgi:hypothetical protein